MNNKLEEIREKMNLNKQEFSKKLGITYQTYQNYIKGREISTEVAIKLKEIYNININWLLANSGNMFDIKIEDKLEIEYENELVEDIKKLSTKKKKYYYHKIKADLIEDELSKI